MKEIIGIKPTLFNAQDKVNEKYFTKNEQEDTIFKSKFPYR